ncbi:LuxR family transcriptional regulator [Pseudacidovorax sp. 1753]|uniref:autoinducer binding domain-containing protein n=1 Tax=Pseudacidovorax sp. 1753 TaxID=3156419 RepID=UPI00339480CA
MGALLEALDRTTSVKGVFAAVQAGASQLGFEWCAYGYQYPVPFTTRRCFLINNYAPLWQARYREAEYVRIDPTAMHARASLEPVLWSDTVFRRSAQLWDEARSFGLRYGWAQACYGPEGGVGLLSLARAVEPLSPAELRSKEVRMRFLVNVAHRTFSERLAQFTSMHLEPLTPREREALRWAADGKTSVETAQILSTSSHTVEFHMKNAGRKLGARNRPSATARAAVTGMLR